MATIKERIAERFPDAEFDRYETDLYVKKTADIYDFLRSEYQFFENVTTFISQTDRCVWLDIPFGAWGDKFK